MQYDLAIIDSSSCERVSGDDLVRLSKEAHPHIPIISYSAYEEKSPGADGFLCKPVTLEETISTVKRLLKWRLT